MRPPLTAALVAAIMSAVELLELLTGTTMTGITPEWIEGTLMVLTPVLVWLVPRWVDR